ncbi:MAG: MFS transporter [Bacteroidales bacterium]
MKVLPLGINFSGKGHKDVTTHIVYRYLMLLTIASAISLQGWRTLFNNFAVDKVGINGIQLGVIQSIREIPGFLSMFVVFILLIIAERKLSYISVMVAGVGVALAGFFPSYIGLIITTFILSLGIHYFGTTNKSLILQTFSTKESPFIFARQNSVKAMTNIALGTIIFFLSKVLNYKDNFLFIGIIVLILAFIASTMDYDTKNKTIQNKGMVFRKRYWLFYVLNFLSGARRQIFIVFSIFMLVQKYHFNVGHITILFVVNNVLTYFVSPIIGSAINKYGERRVLSSEYFMMIFVFLGYAFFKSAWIMVILYFLDNIFYGCSMSINTFFHKCADPKDIAPSMAVGFTINHISAVVLPVLGGLLWMVDYRIPFIAGALIAIISLYFVQKITKEINKAKGNNIF